MASTTSSRAGEVAWLTLGPAVLRPGSGDPTSVALRTAEALLHSLIDHEPDMPAMDAADREEFAIRRSIVESCRAMNALGINQGTSGNISVRWNDGLLLTPSGLPYHEMTPDDVVHLRMDGTCDHPLAPSSEWRLHRDIVESRKDVGAIVHAHPTYCTAFAICGQDIPAVHYMIAAAGGPTVRCGPYVTYGTPELSEVALAALEGRTCCLLANHGMIATGADLGKAMWLAVELETLCRQYAVALQVGEPLVLSDAEIARTVEQFKTYGPRPGKDAA